MSDMQLSISDLPHTPVLIEPIINLISPVSGSWLDGTFGAGGYTRALLEAGADNVISIDRDPHVFDLAKEWIGNYANRIQLHNDKFSNLGNYGSSSTAVIAEYKEGNVINLQWSSKLTYQNSKVIFAQGVRKKGIDEAGVGKAILFSGEKPLNVLDNTQCNYAIKFF